MIRNLIGWLVAATLFAACGVVVGYAYHAARSGTVHAKEEAEENRSAESQPAGEKKEKSGQVVRGDAGEPVVVIDVEGQQRAGVMTAALQATMRPVEMVAQAILQDDPAEVFMVRAPVPGTITADGTSWPRLGQLLKDGTIVGSIAPRLSPVERADLASKLASARAEVDEALASLDAAKNSYESKKGLNTESKMISDRALEEAQTKVKVEEARLDAARETVLVLESSLTATTGPAGPLPLKVARGGLVVQVQAQPGEAIEGGQPIMQVTGMTHLLVRVSLPIGETAAFTAESARVVVPGHEDEPLSAQRLGPASTADPRTGGQSVFFRVATGKFPLQAGSPVLAYLELPGAPRAGVVVPRSAMIQFAGSPWVYVQATENGFARKSAAGAEPGPGGLFVPSGFKPGDRVVTAGAQTLLAIESGFKVSEEEE